MNRFPAQSLLEFSSECELQSHLVTGNHQYVKPKTGMDSAILYFADQKHIQRVSSQEHATPECMELDEVEDDDYYFTSYGP